MGAEAALACSVRGCGLALAARGPALVCARGHAFDRARSGYLNLLQPQDRRAPAPGDSRAALEARARLLAAGFGAALDDELAAQVGRLDLVPGAVAVELGCGTGERLAALARRRALTGIGIDLASAAVDLAARRHPELVWLVANADRRLPLLDGSAALVLSIHGRRNPAECARVLAPGGALVVALPACDDLAELRARVQGEAHARDRVDACLAEHEAAFELRSRTQAREVRAARRAELQDLLAGTYRGVRRTAAEAVAELDALAVTLASDVLVWTRRPERAESSPVPVTDPRRPA